MISIFPQWVQDINTGLSVLGFFITLYVLIEVKYIKNSFLQRARLPEIIKELSKTGSELNKCLNQWPGQRNEAKSQLKIAASLLKSTKKMLPKEERQEIKKMLSKFEAATNSSGDTRISEEDCFDLYADLYSDIRSIVTTMEQLSKNIKWE